MLSTKRWDRLMSRWSEFLDHMHAPAARASREYVVEARYPYQVWELDVPLPARRFTDQADVDNLVEAFHETHERVFAVREQGQQVECLYWKGRARVALPKPTLATAASNGAQHRTSTAADVVGRDDSVDTPVYLASIVGSGSG